MTWRDYRVASCETHHVAGGNPAYATRFRNVGKFHEPGLAPAQDVSGAMHITPDGIAAYPWRFRRTFGFYEGRAAVVADDGWRHVLPDGSALDASTHGWCGNFQEGRCTVRNLAGLYGHVRHDGRAAYEARWRFAGDFKDGLAVVQDANGLHSHIDAEGRLVHGRWFEDLGVFHKGYAIAKDAGGWMHVDTSGRPAYERRFAAAEPFYNGQARMARDDGAIEVIGEDGVCQVTLRGPRRGDFARLSREIVGFWSTEAIAAAVEIGVIEALPGSADELARRLAVHPMRLGTLLRALRELRVVEREGGQWRATNKGGLLARSHPTSLACAALEFAGPLRARWSKLVAALRDDAWTPSDVFQEMAADPVRCRDAHAMLGTYARHDYPKVPTALGLSGREHIIDAGGGLGILAGLLLAEYPLASVTLLERPEVVAQIDPKPFSGRLKPLAWDFLQPWPCTGDVVVLARVLHDWDDDVAHRILANARHALPSGGRVFVVEMLASDDGSFGGLCDLHLLMATGGRERTADAYQALLHNTGFATGPIRRINALPAIIEGTVP